jgi:hypothetical protein
VSDEYGITAGHVAALDQSTAVFSQWLDKMVAAYPLAAADQGRTLAMVGMADALRDVGADRLAIVLSIAVVRLADSAPNPPAVDHG